MSEELEVLRIVAERLRGAGIAYMLTGSVAMSRYAVPRMTRDIDLVVELSAPDVDRVCQLFEGDFYVDRQAVHRAVEAPAAFNMIHTALVVKVDIVVRKETEYRRTEFARRRRVTVEGLDPFQARLGAREPVRGSARRCPESGRIGDGSGSPVPH